MKRPTFEDLTVLIATIPPRDELMQRAVQSVRMQTVLPGKIMGVMDPIGEGGAATKNRGLKDVTTTWVAFLDDDDEFLPNHIQSLVEGLDMLPKTDLFYPWFVAAGREDDLQVLTAEGMRSPFGVGFGPIQRDFIMTVDNFIPCTVMARTALVRDVGGFQEPTGPIQPSARRGQPGDAPFDRDDLGLWRAMLRTGAQFVHIPVRTWVWHWWEGSTGGLDWREHIGVEKV